MTVFLAVLFGGFGGIFAVVAIFTAISVDTYNVKPDQAKVRLMGAFLAAIVAVVFFALMALVLN